MSKNYYDTVCAVIIWDDPVILIRPKKLSHDKKDQEEVLNAMEEIYSKINRKFVHVFDGNTFEGYFHMSMLSQLFFYSHFLKNHEDFILKYCACSVGITSNQAFKVLLNSLLLIYNNKKPVKCKPSMEKALKWCNEHLDISNSKVYKNNVV